MAVPSNVLKNKYEGNGVQTVFPYGFKIFDTSQVIVKKIVGTTETLLVLNTDYTISGVGDDSGGNITYPVSGSPLPSSQYILIKPNFEYVQNTILNNQNTFPPKTVENSLDVLCMQIKQVADELHRSIQVNDAFEGDPNGLIDSILSASSETAADVLTTNANVVLTNSARDATQAAAAGMKWRPSVRASTTVALPSCTYLNGSSGVGATLTATANGALAAQDGVTLIAADRLLVKNQSSGLQNGVYTVTQVGTAGTPFILTRATDADIWTELVSQAVIIEEGSTLADQAYICTVNSGGTVGTTSVTWASFNPPSPTIASQAESEAGTDNTKMMTPLRAKQADIYNLARLAHPYGFTVSNNTTDATNDIDFAAGGGWLSENNLIVIPAGSAMVKRLDATWAAGTNQGGLFSGTKANSTKYYLFVIYDPVNNLVDFGFDTSVVAANRPAAYTEWAWLGMVYTDSGGVILPFLQDEDRFEYRTTLTTYAATTGTAYQTIPEDYTGVPVGRTGTALGFIDCVLGSGASSAFYRETGSGTSTSGGKLVAQNSSTASRSNGSHFEGKYNSAGEIDFRGSAAGVQIGYSGVGFICKRGRR